MSVISGLIRSQPERRAECRFRGGRFRVDLLRQQMRQFLPLEAKHDTVGRREHRGAGILGVKLIQAAKRLARSQRRQHLLRSLQSSATQLAASADDEVMPLREVGAACR